MVTPDLLGTMNAEIDTVEGKSEVSFKKKTWVSVLQRHVITGSETCDFISPTDGPSTGWVENHCSAKAEPIPLHKLSKNQMKLFMKCT